MKHWKEVLPGEETISDDGVPLKCVALRKDKKGRHILDMTDGNSVLTVWASRRQLMWHSLPRKRDWMEDEARRSRTRNTVAAYCVFILRGEPPDYSKLGAIYGHVKHRIPEMAVKILLRQPRIKQMIQEELARILTAAGVTADTVARGIMSAITLAQEKADPANMLRGYENLAKMLGMDKPQLPPSKEFELPGAEDAYFQDVELPPATPELPPASE